MSENPVDHSRISDERDDLHLSPTGAEEWSTSKIFLIRRGNRPIVPHAMAAAIRDVGGDGVDPVEGIEETKGGAGAGIGRCGDLEHSVVASADAIGGKRGPGYVAGEPVELLGILRRERFSGEHGKSGMHPERRFSIKSVAKDVPLYGGGAGEDGETVRRQRPYRAREVREIPLHQTKPHRK
jgi:hypothetical protein